jgi:hypothetical protein
MGICYICGEEFILSKSGDGEHIIPDALGGKLKSKKILCQKHNTDLANELDGEFIHYFASFLSNLSVKKDKNNNITKGAPGIHAESGIKIQSKDGTFVPIEPHWDENKNIIFAPSTKVGNQYREKLKKDSQSKKEAIENATIKTEIEGMGLFPFGFDNQIFKRSFAKIAIGFACENGIKREDLKLALIPEKDKLMKINDKPAVIPYLPLNQEMLLADDDGKGNEFYPMHVIKLFGDSYNNLLYCYVELFSVFKHYVILSDNYSGNDFQKSYYYSLSTQKEILESEYLEKFPHWAICKNSVGGMYKSCKDFSVIISIMQEKKEILEFYHTENFNRMSQYAQKFNMKRKLQEWSKKQENPTNV